MILSSYFDRSRYQSYKDEIESVLKEILASKHEAPEPIQHAMAYTCLQGGKRVRSVMLVALAESLHGARGEALLCGCALEMVHAASLILDDLPCMDNAEVRRGRASCHVEFGEDGAILTAFALLNLAYEVIARLPSSPERTNLLIMRELAQAVGAEGLIAGQWLDLHPQVKHPDIVFVDRIHSLKTGLLFENAAVIAGLLAGRGDVELRNLRDFGLAYGKAFQIVDDINDLLGTPDETGKPSGQDTRKWTHIRIGGWSLVQERFKAHLDHAHRVATGSSWNTILEILVEPLAETFQDLTQRAKDIVIPGKPPQKRKTAPKRRPARRLKKK